MASHALAALAIFVATIALVMTKPRGVHEAIFSCGGAALVLALHLVALRDVLDLARSTAPALLFLAALLVFATLLECGGFFDWAAIIAARAAKGDGRRLYRNVYLVGAVITIFLSLDTTAVILTPIVLGSVRRLQLPARPYIYACAFVANMASLPLPMSNLTNLLYTTTFHIPFLHFVGVMLFPQLVTLVVSFVLLRVLFNKELPQIFAVENLPTVESVIPSRGYFRVCVLVFGLVCVGYFVAPLLHVESYIVGFVGAGVLCIFAVAAKRVNARTFREINWSIFPFVFGLFVVVRAVQNVGVLTLAIKALQHLPTIVPLRVFVFGGLFALLSNLVNNLPAALWGETLLQHNHNHADLYATLLGTNIGSTLTLVGSLATMLVFARARQAGESVSATALFKVSVIVTPLTLLAALSALFAVSLLGGLC